MRVIIALGLLALAGCGSNPADMSSGRAVPDYVQEACFWMTEAQMRMSISAFNLAKQDGVSALEFASGWSYGCSQKSPNDPNAAPSCYACATTLAEHVYGD